MKIYYRRKYPIGSFLNEDIGFEVDLEVDQLTPDGKVPNPLEAFKILKGMCDLVHKEINPEFHSQYIENQASVQPVEEPVDKRIAILIQDIQNTDVLDEVNGLGVQVGLLGFAKMVSAHPDLQAAYDKRLKELTK